MSVQILQNLIESINYFCVTLSIRRLIPTDFTVNIVLETTVWENQVGTKEKEVPGSFCYI